MRAKLPNQEGRLSRGGIELHYEVYGDGEHTILFVPTWALVHSRNYKAQIPYLSDRFRVVTYDPRGNGKSDRPCRPEDYGLDALVDDGIAMLDHLGIERATIFSSSMGGIVASALASYHPDRAETLILVSPLVPLVPQPQFENHDFAERLDTYEGWQKFNVNYWRENYSDFAEFFIREVYCEPHSTKQVEDALSWAAEGDGEILAMTLAFNLPCKYAISEKMYRAIRSPTLLIHGGADRCTPPAMSEALAEWTGGELHILPGVGHAAHARWPAWVNVRIRDFLHEKLGTGKPECPPRQARTAKKVLYLSSPIGLGHARRDLAVARELRELHPGLQIDWLAQDPVTRLLKAGDERVHPGSDRLANESSHLESEAGEHDLHAFRALRDMDEILIRNFMVFQEAVEAGDYDLVIADEAWDVDHFWHEHPELKRTQIAWFTDFVGFVPMPEGGEAEALLTTDYNAEMIGHVERVPRLRDLAMFVGNPDDVVPLSFGKDLPAMRDWIPQYFRFTGYILGEHPHAFGSRAILRSSLGYEVGEKVCIVTVGGTGVGAALIKRVLEAFPLAKRRLPELRMIVVTGPRIAPESLPRPDGVEFRTFVLDLDRHLAACDLAVVQGGLTTCMELAAAGTPFLYFPLRNHFEQNFHVAHRLDSYGAGRRMSFQGSDADTIAETMIEELRAPRTPSPVEADGPQRAATLLAQLL